MLFCLRALRPGMAWKNAPLSIAFWSINIGLALMVLLSLLPIGLMQAWASVEYGTWYARSAEFMDRPLIHMLVWMRMPGDIVFSIGALLISVFVASLWLARKPRAGMEAPAQAVPSRIEAVVETV